MYWNNVRDSLPPLSYNESDDTDYPYTSFSVLVFSPEKPGIMCVAYLTKNQHKDDWNFGHLYWEVYLPGEEGDIIPLDFETFTHWRKLPPLPKVNL